MNPRDYNAVPHSHSNSCVSGYTPVCIAPPPLLSPDEDCIGPMGTAQLLHALEAIATCACKEAPEMPVQDFGLVFRPKVSDLSFTYPMPDKARDVSIYNGTQSIARVTLSTGFCYVPPNGTQVLTNTVVEPRLKPFEGGNFSVSFDRSPGLDSFLIINFRIF